MPFSRFSRMALAAALAASALVAAKTALADRMALWKIVHDQCVPHARAGTPLPTPCLAVNLSAGEARGDAVIKDRAGVAQLLEIPTARLTGIEDPGLLAPGAPNYFAAAWRAREEMARYVKMPPPGALSIAINSQQTRSQDQFHLHIDCLRPEVADALAAYAAKLDGHWLPMTVALVGRRYFARRADTADFTGLNPFRLLADDMPKARGEMGLWSLAAIPAQFQGKPGFILLADHTELADGGHAEDLQDHTCAVSK